VQRLFDEMAGEAASLGEKLIAQEAHLDRLFAERTATFESLRAATAAIGETQGALRQVHLRYHLLTAPLLTPHQVRRYAELRGYGGGHRHMHRH
jgi:hypothetical protein